MRSPRRGADLRFPDRVDRAKRLDGIAHSGDEPVRSFVGGSAAERRVQAVALLGRKTPQRLVAGENRADGRHRFHRPERPGADGAREVQRERPAVRLSRGKHRRAPIADVQRLLRPEPAVGGAERQRAQVGTKRRDELLGFGAPS